MLNPDTRRPDPTATQSPAFIKTNQHENYTESEPQFKVAISIGTDPYKSREIETRTFALAELDTLFSRYRTGDKMGQYFCAPLAKPHRCKDNALPWQLFALDFDGADGIVPNHAVLREYFKEITHWGYSTHSYKLENGKHRIILLLDRPVNPWEYRALFDALADSLPFAPDTKLNHPDQPVFLPARPANGPEPIYWNERGQPFNVDSALKQAAERHQAESRAVSSYRPPADPSSVIARFNASHDIRQILETHNYQQRGIRYLHPNSESGIPSVSIMASGKLAYSHSSSDPLGDGQPHDAFDCLAILEHGGDKTAATRAVVKLLGNDRPADKPKPKKTVVLTRAATITPIKVDWLWDGWLARGKFHVLAGPPGSGKTTIAVALAVTLSCGGKWPDGTQAKQGNTLVWSGEDDPADTLLPRLLACGADPGQVFFVDGMLNTGGVTPFDPAIHSHHLVDVAAEIGGIDLLIIDPVVSAVSGDSHKNAEVRRSLQPLVDLAAETGCAVLGITHFSKGTAGRDPVERVTGSIAFGALARVVLAALPMPTHDRQGGSRLFCRTKSNLGPDTGGFRYDLRQTALATHQGITASALQWGTFEEGSARELMARAEQHDGEAELNPCCEWIKDFLSNGPKTAKEMAGAGKAAAFTPKQLRIARTKLKVTYKRAGFQGDFKYALPEGTFRDAQKPDSASCLKNEGNIGEVGGFRGLDSTEPPNLALAETCPEGAGETPDIEQGFLFDSGPQTQFANLALGATLERPINTPTLPNLAHVFGARFSPETGARLDDEEDF